MLFLFLCYWSLCWFFIFFKTHIIFDNWIHLGADLRFDRNSINIVPFSILPFCLVNGHTAWSFKSLLLFFSLWHDFFLFIGFVPCALVHFWFLDLFWLLLAHDGTLAMSIAFSFRGDFESWFRFYQLLAWIADKFLFFSRLFFQILWLMMSAFILLDVLRDIYWIEILIVLDWLRVELSFGGGVRVCFIKYLGGVWFRLWRSSAYFMCRLLIWLKIFCWVVLS